MENTKKRILEAALVSFAENGYKGTNLRDLASQLGVTKSALYKHYDSKEAIWNAVLDMMESYYTTRFGSVENMPETPESCGELLTMTMRMLDFTLHDRNVILTRRLLLTEQFRDERARRLATLHFLTGTRDMYAGIFSDMMKRGLLIGGDPAVLAFAYTAPITALIHLCDREPDREPDVKRQIRDFIDHFITVYGVRRPDEEAAHGIGTDRLTIRMATDDEMRDMIAREPDDDMKQAYGEMLAMCEAHPDERMWYAAWTIELPEVGRIGDLCFKGLSPEGMVEIGYGLFPAYWGRGYATEAVRAMVAWAAKQPGVSRIEAETDAGNTASMRVLEKAGFVPTGQNGEEGPRFVWRS